MHMYLPTSSGYYTCICMALCNLMLEKGQMWYADYEFMIYSSPSDLTQIKALVCTTVPCGGRRRRGGGGERGKVPLCHTNVHSCKAFTMQQQDEGRVNACDHLHVPDY
jgi:hypothetical protein